MPPRGLKKFLVDSAPGKLVKRGKFSGYRAIGRDGKAEGPMLSGITKLLHSRLYSDGQMDDAAIKSTEYRGGPWKGEGGGIRRGKAVDSQVSRLSGVGAGKRNSSSKFKMTTLAFSALNAAGLEPLTGQRVVINRTLGLGTAADIVCYRKTDNSIVVVELKTGYSGNRTLPAVSKTRSVCKLEAPCSSATDCFLHRHLAQLTATRHMMATEGGFLKTLSDRFQINSVNGVLLYACDRDTALHTLDQWWVKRGKAIVNTISN